MDISHYFKLMAEKDASDMFLSTGAPVSYTHLDVYKRQRYGITFG